MGRRASPTAGYQSVAHSGSEQSVRGSPKLRAKKSIRHCIAQCRDCGSLVPLLHFVVLYRHIRRQGPSE
ncbi:hypothetical protein NDU88_001114 [Pleurodeles waltl]|uniref:Uncharacterized protein n=1 Tax=Pleurodeles waltl TaxID=8319 RepID=A0AAV7LYK1_PLEWA|nr:hypothetical protein NDU88_001114 [Pleurodeles waltl]